MSKRSARRLPSERDSEGKETADGSLAAATIARVRAKIALAERLAAARRKVSGGIANASLKRD